MSIETLIRCCAPTMACLKTGNMFNCTFGSRSQMTGELRRLNQRLGRKGLRILPLRWRDGKALLYLYRPGMLERDLRDPLARRLLTECGYSPENTSACLARLITRLRMWTASCTGEGSASSAASGRCMTTWKARSGSSPGAAIARRST